MYNYFYPCRKQFRGYPEIIGNLPFHTHLLGEGGGGYVPSDGTRLLAVLCADTAKADLIPSLGSDRNTPWITIWGNFLWQNVATTLSFVASGRIKQFGIEVMRMGKHKGKTMYYATLVTQEEVPTRQRRDRVINAITLSRSDVHDNTIITSAETVREEEARRLYRTLYPRHAIPGFNIQSK